MAEILTNWLVMHAINLLRPAIREILEDRECIWGPKWVEVEFSGPGGVYVQMVIGNKVKWKSEWGEEKNFTDLARCKHDLSQREKMSGSEIVQLQPWRLQIGDWLYSGSAYREGNLTCGVSGAKGEIDELIANLILEMVMGLCILRRRQIQDNGVKQIC